MKDAVELLNVQQAAERLAVSKGEVYELCRARRIRHHRIGIGNQRGAIRIPEDAIEEFLRQTVVDVVPILEPPPPMPQPTRAKPVKGQGSLSADELLFPTLAKYMK